MIIFYDDDNKIVGTVESPFEDGFDMPSNEKIKINKKDFTKEELKEITSHKLKIKDIKDKLKKDRA